jgi:cytochrome c oxidase subunit II
VALVRTQHEFAGVEGVYLPVAIAVVAIVYLAVAFAVVRYRAGRHPEPRPTKDHNLLEIGIASLIAIVVAGLVVVTFSANASETEDHDPIRFRVDVLAYKWGWQFTYPSLPGVVDRTTDFRPPVLHVPADTTVEITLRTQDVTHAFWVPAVRYKQDAWTGETRRFRLVFPPGDHLSGHCAQYCGLRHSDMTFTVASMGPAEFRAWSARARGRTP